jgi:tetratricopeptide (TPR) repeat protein
MLEYLSLTLACLGYIDQARSRMDEAVSEARRVGRVYPLAYALFQQTWLDWITGSPMLHLEELLARSSEQGFAFFLGWALALRGWSLIARGQAQEGLASLTQGLTELRPTGATVHMPVLLTWLAKTHAMLGQTAEERNCLADASRLLEASEAQVFEAELLHRVPGDLLNAAGDQPGAERHYLQAIAVAERQSAKLFQLRASTSLARLWRDQGKRAEARELLGPIYNWFTEGFDALDLKDAKALLDELA